MTDTTENAASTTAWRLEYLKRNGERWGRARAPDAGTDGDEWWTA